MKYITRTVWILSLVSLFNDTASEMLYPVLPIYLKSIGFSIVLIGILEGIAEATAGLSKGYFGKLSDSLGKRLPFVQIGYALNAVAKPMMAVCTYQLWIFFARATDRLGKGIRTGACDAMLSNEATPQTKGKIFGFHRSMDTLGAVIGPLMALVYLWFFPKQYVILFYIAFIPGLCAAGATFFLTRNKQPQTIVKKTPPFFSFLKYWKVSPPLYRKVVIGLLVFTLFNSSDVFLLLKAKHAGMNDTAIIGVYIFYNLIYALFSFPLGIVADKIGLKTMFIIGLTLFALVYFGMSTHLSISLFMGLFFLYGLYAAATDGVTKAWISNISDKKDTATALGSYAGYQSLCTMIASSLAGFIWFRFGANATFLVTGIATVAVIIYFLFIANSKRALNITK